MITENTVKEITKAIINTVKPAKVILFGSYARGNAGTDSDLDFLVIRIWALLEKVSRNMPI